MAEAATTQERILYLPVGAAIAAFAVVGVADNGWAAAWRGFLQLQTHGARLISDFTVIGGTGGALLNAAAVAAIGLAVVRLSGVRLSGPTVAAIFTILGFGLFGKTVLNILPIMSGVFVATKIVGKPFSAYLLIALFGSALGPLVSYLVFESGLTGFAGIAVGWAAGMAAGVCLPPLALAMLHLHQGYNLYNIGLTCGFFGLFAAAILAAAKRDLDLVIVWNADVPPTLRWLAPAISCVFIAIGLVSGRKAAVKDFLAIQKMPGRLPSDFTDLASAPGALVNAGLLGLCGCGYVAAVGGDFSGPALGGLMTLIGFGLFGKTLRNCWPIAAGVVLSCVVFGKELNAPGPLIAALFGTTLAPIAGQFGIAAGMAAGFIHLVMVERSAAWHGGLDLYNNGFAGGLTATLLVAIIEWYRANIGKKGV